VGHVDAEGEPNSMKAILCERYGPPEVLRLAEVDRPIPKGNEVVVAVTASSVNPFDWRRMRASPFLVRMGGGLRRPKDPRLGQDVAGMVDSVGRNVTRWTPGAPVFGLAEGSFADFAKASEDDLAPKPTNLTYDSAAATPMAALTALKGLRDQGQIHAGQHVLVNGASGGVGTFAVQIAKAYGAEVTGVCSTRNLDLVRSIGADHVIDYTREDFTRGGPRYDLILDAVGNHSVSQYKRAMTPQGISVVVGFTSMLRMMRILARGKVASQSNPQKVGMMMARPNEEDRTILGDLLTSGQVTPVIDRTYALPEVPEALRYLEAGHARGKVVIRVLPALPTG
jgi:NADPH:quinone reductase-like Zn-dependent oxidoreductase